VSQADVRARWLSTCVLPHEGALRRWLEQKRMRGVEVDDIIQDTYATLARLESVAGIRNPRAYVYQTAYSLALVCLRRARTVSIEAVADIDRVAATSAPSAEELVSGHQELSRAADVLEELPHRCREVFVLRRIHGLSQREVATQLSITEGTVEKQVHKAVQRLIALLGRGRKSAARASRVRITNEPYQEIEND
jgi:RNA polymerase sigma factor (sigma-70 family)